MSAFQGGPDGERSAELTLIIRTPRDVTASAAVSPVMSKLYQESSLRAGPSVAVMNPRTAKRLGISKRATLEVCRRNVAVNVITDDAVMPGVVEMSVAPDAKWTSTSPLLDRIEPDETGCWRTLPVRVVEA